MIMVMTFAPVRENPHSILRAVPYFSRESKASEPRARARKLPPARRRDASSRGQQFSRALALPSRVVIYHSFMLLLLWSKISYYSHNSTSSCYVSLTRITFWCKTFYYRHANQKHTQVTCFYVRIVAVPLMILMILYSNYFRFSLFSVLLLVYLSCVFFFLFYLVTFLINLLPLKGHSICFTGGAPSISSPLFELYF